MARIAIIGASTGGLPAAYETKAAGPDNEVTIISSSQPVLSSPSTR